MKKSYAWIEQIDEIETRNKIKKILEEVPERNKKIHKKYEPYLRVLIILIVIYAILFFVFYKDILNNYGIINGILILIVPILVLSSLFQYFLVYKDIRESSLHNDEIRKIIHDYEKRTGNKILGYKAEILFLVSIIIVGILVILIYLIF